MASLSKNSPPSKGKTVLQGMDVNVHTQMQEFFQIHQQVTLLSGVSMKVNVCYLSVYRVRFTLK